MIAITGATGQTGSKTTNLLLDHGKKVRVIGRAANKLESFKKRGAEVAVGDQSDAGFLAEAFAGISAVYLLIPPKFDTTDGRGYYNRLGDAAITAIKQAQVKKIVFLSSLGAELDSGSGPVIGLHDVEAKLRALSTLDIAILRPGYFMENLLWNASLIKSQHINGNTAVPDAPVAMIATRDIAKKAAELLSTLSFSGHTIYDLFGDKISYQQATKLIGEDLQIPNLPYIQFPEADAIKSMTGMGLSESMARSFVELSSAISKGLIHATTIDPQKPNTGTSFKTFAHEVFRPAYLQVA